MDLIHADTQLNERGVVEFVRFDGAISLEDDADENDWEVQLLADDLERYDIGLGDYLYFPGTEWGGCIEKIEHISKSGVVKISGVNWRGMLARKVILPPAGASHLDLREREINEVIGLLVNDRFGGLFEARVESSGLLCGKKFRFQTVLEGIADMLGDHGLRLEVTLDRDVRKVWLCARIVADHSDEIEFSGDYDLSYTSTLGEARFNHIIALGRGEQEERTVRHLYLLPDGSVTENATADGVATGWRERELVYDYPNCEDENDLMRGAKRKLLKYAVQNTIDFSFDSADIDLPLGDKVGLRDRITGMSDVKTVSRKLLTVSAAGVSLEYRVE